MKTAERRFSVVEATHPAEMLQNAEALSHSSRGGLQSKACWRPTKGGAAGAIGSLTKSSRSFSLLRKKRAEAPDTSRQSDTT